MPIPMQIQRQFDALHRDAQRVLSSIDNLSQDFGKANSPSEKTETREPLNLENLRSSLATLRTRIDDTSRAVVKQAKQIDGQIHAQPYAFIAGALGLGALTALVIERRLAHK